MIPKYAIIFNKRRVEVLRYTGNGFFDVLDTVGQGKARRERILFVHRKNLTFISDQDRKAHGRAT